VREPWVDIDTTADQVTIGLELPAEKKECKINATEDSVEVKSPDAKRKYHENIGLPKNIEIENVKSQSNNGILEITFHK